mmetsp:Transcript_100496/g.283436  ORF Transcript_100496/g.283436 Transcript_100496/m.283436 type:complete len:217 (-) Transcript_100496:3120-3770(-)
MAPVHQFFLRRLLEPPSKMLLSAPAVHFATSLKGLSMGSAAAPSLSPPSPWPLSSAPSSSPPRPRPRPRPFLPRTSAALRFLPRPTGASSFVCEYKSTMALSKMSRSVNHICWGDVFFTLSSSAAFSLAILSNSSLRSFVSDAICMISKYSKPVLGSLSSPNFWNFNLVRSLTTSIFFLLLMWSFFAIIMAMNLARFESKSLSNVNLSMRYFFLLP